MIRKNRYQADSSKSFINECKVLVRKSKVLSSRIDAKVSQPTEYKEEKRKLH